MICNYHDSDYRETRPRRLPAQRPWNLELFFAKSRAGIAGFAVRPWY